MRTSTSGHDPSQHKISPEEALATSGAEATTTVLRAFLSTLPVVGGPATELLNAILLPSLAKRRDRYFRDLYYDLRGLEEC